MIEGVQEFFGIVKLIEFLFEELAIVIFKVQLYYALLLFQRFARCQLDHYHVLSYLLIDSEPHNLVFKPQ